MNIREVPHKLEISFWTVVISLMSKKPGLRVGGRKTLRTLTYVGLIVSIFVLAFWAGKLALGMDFSTLARIQAAAPQTPVTVATPEKPGNGQRSILVIGVEDLEASRPRLESIWMVLYFDNSPQLTLLPVYPPLSDEPDSDDKALAKHFRLDDDKAPTPKFQDFLRSEQFWWDGFVVLDRVALEEINRLSSQATRTEDAKIIERVPFVRQKPAEALQGQVSVLKQLCRQSANLSPSADISSLLALFSHHLVTDLDLAGSIRDWKGMYQQGNGFSCDFPTIEGS